MKINDQKKSDTKTENSKGPKAVSNVVREPEVSERSKIVPTLNVSPGDVNIAFKPFENAIFDLKGLFLMLEDLTLVERALFRGKDGTISFKARDFTTGNVIGMFDQIEKMGLEPTVEKKQLEFLKDLTAHLRGLSVVKVTFAFAPTNTFIEKISSAISAILNKKILLDIVINEYIVGGAVFEYEGKVSRQTLDIQLEAALGKYMR